MTTWGGGGYDASLSTIHNSAANTLVDTEELAITAAAEAPRSVAVPGSTVSVFTFVAAGPDRLVNVVLWPELANSKWRLLKTLLPNPPSLQEGLGVRV